MPKQARFTIGIPINDNLGNPLEDLSTKVHHILHDQGVLKGSYITGPHKSNWAKDPQEMIEHFITVADDTPENDTHIKNVAKYVGEAANQWGTFCMKEGHKGIQSWVINNPKHEPKLPAPASRAPTTYPQNSGTLPHLTHYQRGEAFR